VFLPDTCAPITRITCDLNISFKANTRGQNVTNVYVDFDV